MEAARKLKKAAADKLQIMTPEEQEFDDLLNMFIGFADDAGMRAVSDLVMVEMMAVVNDDTIEDTTTLNAELEAALRKEFDEDEAAVQAKKFSQHLVPWLEVPTTQRKLKLVQRNNEEMVFVTKTRKKGTVNEKGRETKAPRHEKAGKQAGHQAGGHTTSETLGVALSKLERKPKPRAMKEIDEILWSASRQTADAELLSEYELKITLEEHYFKMCNVGKALLAKEVQVKTQRIYDNRATKQFHMGKQLILGIK